MAEAFRNQLNSFRNSSSQTTQTETAPVGAGGGFSRFYDSIASSVGSTGGYIPLRSNEVSNETEAWGALSRWDKLIGFGACLIGAAVCFAVAFFFLPMIAFSPHKFATAFSMGSLLVMFGFAVLTGPITHLKHLLSAERLPFTAVYFGSLGLTLYFSLGAHSKIGALLAAIVQIIALMAYVAAYFPGGLQTLRFGGSMALRGVGSLLPI